MLVFNGDPIAFSIGSIEIRYYGLLFAGGFIIGYFIMSYMFKKLHKNTDDLDKLLVYIFFGTIIGARLGHCIFYEPDFYFTHPIEILKIYKGGLASHGGTLGVIIAILIFLRKNKQYSFLMITDMLSIPVALVATMIRIGNFLNSEIIGKVSDGPFAIVFMRFSDQLPRHPVQLYEACAYFIIFLLLSAIYIFYKKRPQGFIFSLLIILIFSVRLFLEQFKLEQADYDTNFFLNVGQILSIPFIIAGVITLIYVFKKQRRS